MIVADQAVLAFLQIMIKINTDNDLLAYRKDKNITSIKELKGYKVKMGFGLHFGWAIEGSIGSVYKIDASYLSPNVNISARLEAATKQYGVNILISGELYDLCSHQIKFLCRLIDVVAVKGSVNPIRLYTIDTNDNFKSILYLNKKKEKNNRKRFASIMIDKENLLLNGKKYGNYISYILQTAHFKHLLRINRPDEFLPTFNNGIDCYLQGNWKEASEHLRKCLRLCPKDGPSKTIYDYIKTYNFKAEKLGSNAWKGYRQLVSK